MSNSADKFMGKRKAFLEAAALRRSLTDQLGKFAISGGLC